MRKIIASFALIGMIFINIDTYGMFEEESSVTYQKCDHDSWYPEKLPLKPIDAKHTKIDARPLDEYIAESYAKGPKYGELLQAIKDKNTETVFLITKELPDNDEHKLLGADCYCRMQGVLDEIPDEESKEEKEQRIERKKLAFEIHDSGCSSLEWVSDVLYSAALYFNRPLSEGKKEYYLSQGLWSAQWVAQWEAHSEKTRNYICNCPNRTFQCTYGEKKRK
jgi:hypothetical protein